MARNSVDRVRRRLATERSPAASRVRVLLAVASWGAALGLAQVVLGGDVARAVHDLEQRIELRVKGLSAPVEPQPQRSHEDDSLEPWELVSV